MQNKSNSEKSLEVATLAGGCFWCLEAVYLELKGVETVVSGYSNGHVPEPTYKEVCSGSTGHAEVVQITYDSSIINFEDLLDVFFTIHDPTTLNRQGADVGTQYRSAILYHNEDQRRVAEEKIRELEAAGLWKDRIVTEITPLDRYYPAEEYHQNYFEHNPQQAYCQYVVAPKVAKARKKFYDRLRVTA